MYNPYEIATLLDQAETGAIPPSSPQRLEDAEALVGLAFGLRFTLDGQLESPGPVNDALAERLVGDEVMRSKELIILQEELAVAVIGLDKSLASRIEVVPTIKEPFTTYSTRHVVLHAAGILAQEDKNSAIAFAMSYHLPRTAAYMRKSGLSVAIPNMYGVGDFDPESRQPQVRNLKQWMKHERLSIGASAVLNWI